MAEQYITLRVVMDKLMRNPLLTDLSLETVIDYTIDFIRIVGVPTFFKNKVSKLSISNYSVTLPDDFSSMVQMRYLGGSTSSTLNIQSITGTGTIATVTFPTQTQNPFEVDSPIIITNSSVEGYNNTTFYGTHPIWIVLTCTHSTVTFACTETETAGIQGTVKGSPSTTYSETLRSSTDTFHLSEDQVSSNDNTFVVSDSYVHSSLESGEIEISYLAINTDADGLPMIPESSNFTRALIAYIKNEYYSILYDQGKIGQAVMSKSQQDYAWAVGSCITDGHKLNLAKAESLFNMWRSLIPKSHEFGSGFKSLGTLS